MHLLNKDSNSIFSLRSIMKILVAALCKSYGHFIIQLFPYWKIFQFFLLKGTTLWFNRQSHHLTAAAPHGVLVRLPSVPFPVQPLVNSLVKEKAAQTFGSLCQVWNSAETSGSWFQISQALAVAANRNESVGEVFVSFPLNSVDFQIHNLKKITKQKLSLRKADFC